MVFEKAYLHVDRDKFISGEDIWYKAYLVDAGWNRLTGNSGVLYVELISPSSRILYRQRIKLEAGMGKGDFQLDDTLSPGTYLIRAYTNWMRNFGEDFYYYKEINILNPENPDLQAPGTVQREDTGIVPGSVKGTDSGSAPGSVPGDDTGPDHKAGFDIQFFPEGGSLVAGVPTRIGFKAVDASGIGCPVDGIVVSMDGKTHARLESTHLGMGSFNLRPEAGSQYRAVLFRDNDLADTHDLPLVFDQGLVLNVHQHVKDELVAVIKTNREMLSRHDSLPLYLQVKTGEGNFLVRISLSHTAQSIKLQKNSFPPGISHLVLYDAEFKPHCERLVFVDPPPVTVLVEPDKSIYATNGKTSLRIKVSDDSGRPLPAELSLSAVDANAISGSGDHASHIRSHLYLESELRGNIENPGYYFNVSNADRSSKLDLLLITQGWRDFIWKYPADTTFGTPYPAETGLAVTGRLLNNLGKRPLADASISLAIMGSTSNFYGISLTDAEGRYSFRDIDIQGSARVLVSGVDNRGRQRGRIQLDSIRHPEVVVDYRWKSIPDPDTQAADEYLDEAEAKLNILKRYHLNDTIPIEEVSVTAKRIVKKDTHQRIYGQADNVVEIEEHERYYRDIFELIQGKVPGVMISGQYPNYTVLIRGVNNLRNDIEPLYLLDGMPVGKETIMEVQVRNVDKVEVLKNIANIAMYGSRGANGVIIVYTKNTMDPVKASPALYTISGQIRGCHAERIFYAPGYDKPKSDSQPPDLRTTIHWEPRLRISEYGERDVVYFNSDIPSQVKVIVEGITGQGIPVNYSTSYSVE